jgi:ribose 5-phosphate isomerase
VGAALGFDASHQDGVDRLVLGLVVGLGVGMTAAAFVRHDES